MAAANDEVHRLREQLRQAAAAQRQAEAELAGLQGDFANRVRRINCSEECGEICRKEKWPVPSFSLILHLIHFCKKAIPFAEEIFPLVSTLLQAEQS